MADVAGTALEEVTAVWASLSVAQKIDTLSFGRGHHEIASKCKEAFVELQRASQLLAATVGVHTNLKEFVLVSSMEFISSDRTGQLRGMTFGPKLISRGDMWDVLERALPGWCRSGTPSVHESRWPSLLEPLPTTWHQLETVLSAILEQRFLRLRCGTLDAETDAHKKQQVIVDKTTEECKRKKKKTRASQKGTKQKQPHQPYPTVAAQVNEGEVSVQASEENEGTDACELKREQLEEVADVELQRVSEDVPEEQNREAEEGANVDRSELQNQKLDDTHEKETEVLSDDDEQQGTWQPVQSRRKRQEERVRFASAADDCDQAHPGVAEDEAEDSTAAACGSDEEDESLCNPDLWRFRVPVSYLRRSKETMPRIERLMRSWREASIKAEREWRDTRGSMRHWHLRRKDNASWRLWYIEKMQPDKRNDPKSLLEDLEPMSCLRCAKGENVGMACHCCMKVFDRRSGFPDPKADNDTDTNSTTCTDPSPRAFGDSGSAVSPLASSQQEVDDLLADCFAPLPADTEQDPHDWQQLLCGVPNTVETAVKLARRENATWTHWATVNWVKKADDHLPTLLFPATPTSTAPCTPRSGFPDTTFYTEHTETSHMMPVVNFSVPLHIAPQVHQFIESLLAPAALADRPA
eukprot:TRINITY_DN40335_c0_g1_i1.p1 TRINITY_DN40335_c0_g1~~TRINITY_DN40335_c0_g1_i1.p1  ORF type:complete len:639 (+),score=131.91 TRINITY_DN40335_c0_g1_i1:66-1982(+)